MATVEQANRRNNWRALAVQVVGGVAFLAGAYLAWGIAATLMVAGAAGVVLGALREAKVI